MAITLDGSVGITTPSLTDTGTLSVTGVSTLTGGASLAGVNASPYAMKNRIINGAMVIDQRNAGAATANTINNYTLDRWVAIQSPTGKIIVQQNAGSVTPPAGFSNYFGVTSQSSYTPSSSEYSAIYQAIEGYNVADLDFGKSTAKTITLSFWVRSSLTGTFSGCIQNAGQTRSYVFSYTISSANTWEQKTVTIAGDTGGSGSWNVTNGVGLYLFFSLGSGSNYSGTANTWSAANYLQASGTTSVIGTNGATFYITGVQLEKGSTATEFEWRPYGNELALCQRYYFKTTPLTGNQPAYNVLGSLSTTRSISMQGVPMKVTMRSSPTVGYNSVMVTNAATSVISSTISSVTLYNSSTGQDYVTLDVGYSAGGASGNIYALSANAAGSYLDFSSEL